MVLETRVELRTAVTRPVPQLPVYIDGETLQPASQAEPPLQQLTRIQRQLVAWPTEEQAAAAQKGFWVCLPWSTELTEDVNKLPRWDQHLTAYKAASATGISPYFHGNAMVCSTSNTELYNRVKFVSGILLSCDWLRDLVCAELVKLHGSNSYKLRPVGIIVTSRVQHTLATYPDPQELLPNASALQKQLDLLNWASLEHGLLNTGVRASNIGITKISNGKYELQLLAWTEHHQGICLVKLPSSKHREAITLCVSELTRGIVIDALRRRECNRGLLGWIW
jgi:hypothetical protein